MQEAGQPTIQKYGLKRDCIDCIHLVFGVSTQEEEQMVNYQRNSLGSRLRGRPKRYLALVSARSHVLKIGAVLAHANQY